jgi:hypothetical protein
VRPLGSVRSLECLCKTCRLSWIHVVFIRDLLAQLILYGVYEGPVGSVRLEIQLNHRSRIDTIEIHLSLQVSYEHYMNPTEPTGLE